MFNSSSSESEPFAKGDHFLVFISSTIPWGRSFSTCVCVCVCVWLLGRSSSVFIWGGWFGVEHVSEGNQMLLPICGHPGPWIQDPGSRILDPVSRILDPVSRILDPGSVIQDPGSRILDPESWIQDSASRIRDLEFLSQHPGFGILGYVKGPPMVRCLVS